MGCWVLSPVSCSLRGLLVTSHFPLLGVLQGRGIPSLLWLIAPLAPYRRPWMWPYLWGAGRAPCPLGAENQAGAFQEAFRGILEDKGPGAFPC